MRTRHLLKWIHTVLVIAVLGNLVLPALARSSGDMVRPGVLALANPAPRLAPILSPWQQVLAQGNVSCASPSPTPSGGQRVFLPLILKSGGSSGSVATIAATLGDQALPPDPGMVAPSLDRTVSTILFTATQFLYTGANPIQIQVPANTIKPLRVAVLRGIVRERSGAPLTGVLIKVLDHPEYGCTFSRADGAFDLVVNGGGSLTLSYEKSGYLAAQRQESVPIQDYAWLEEVRLIPYDSQATAIDLTAPDDFQVARGSTNSDTDGSRQATLLFPKNTSANITLPNGVIQALNIDKFNVRATEYTVGDGGLESMPGELPAQSGYTYAVDFSIDEAVAAGAISVQFNQPVFFYVENFLDVPVGKAVPAGYYDQIESQWVASNNGQVIKILSIGGGLANVDTTGNGQADNGVGIGMTQAERARLAVLYTAGQSLWRVPITHFTPWDCNYPYGPPADAATPPKPPMSTPTPAATTKPPKEPQQCGSTIGIHSQSLGEQVDIVGTPFRLHYQSERMLGHKGGYTLRIPLSDDTLPVSVKEIVLEIQVAGRQLSETFEPDPNQVYSFTWDGKDGYGRLVQGSQPILVRVGYVYDAEYQEPAQLAQSFAAFSGVPMTGVRARQEITLWQEWKSKIGGWDWAAQKLGGWSLSVHHVYDPGSQTLYMGDGSQRSTEVMGQVISTIAGNGNSGNTGNGGPAVNAQIRAADVAVGPDGSLYIASNPLVRRVDPQGIISNFAGGGNPPDDLGDGGPATQAKLSSVHGLALGPDGSLYISERFSHRVRRVGPDGLITTMAGNGSAGYSGDGGSATQAQLDTPTGLAVGPDGSLYIADHDNDSIRRVGPDGIITTVAGDGTRCQALNPCGDGGPANQAKLFGPEGVAVAPDGTLYLTSYTGYLHHVGLDGLINVVTEVGNWQGQGIAFGPDGSLYISRHFGLGGYVYRVEPDGSRVIIAGNGSSSYNGDGQPATQAGLIGPAGIEVGPDGAIYISDENGYRVRKVGSALAGFSNKEIGIPSEDGALFYIFDESGRHLRTLNAFTGAVMYTFSYNGAGLLAQIQDGDSNLTILERAANGNATAIVGPYGQRTTLAMNANNYLASITNPAGQSHQFSYLSDGLLLNMTDPRNQPYQFAYDALGRLLQDADPAGGAQTLARTELGDGFIIDHTTTLNRNTDYQVQSLASGDQTWLTTAPDGTQTETAISYRDANRSTTYADDTLTNRQEGADPRFGMQSPVPIQESVTTPGGLAYNATTQRAVTLANPQNPLSLTSLNETATINGRQFTSAYNAATRQFTLTTPEGRQSTVTIDTQGRIIQETMPSLDAINYTYDSRGRLANLTQGTGSAARTIVLSYNSAGYLANLTDPLNRNVSFSYDAAGRVTNQTLPGNRTVAYGYDANGNVTSLTPPGRPAHTFSYTAVDLTAGYTPPGVSGGGATSYSYNLDRQLSQITRPDGQVLSFGYDGGGRLSSLTTPRGPTTYAYQSTTGNLASITAPGNSILNYSYDGSLLTSQSWVGPVVGSVGYTYDNNFRVTARRVNGGNAINFQYDNDSLLTAVGSLSLSRNAQNGLLTGSTLGNVTDTWGYNSFGEASSYGAAYNGAAIYNVLYNRDKLGRITAKTETIGGVTTVYSYTYDLAGRLAGVQQNGTSTAAYTYDANDNRLTGPGGAAGTYDNQDRLLQYGTSVYSYTANGELKSKTSGGQTTTYNYDVLGNVITVTLPTSQISYVVDGQNRRIGKRINGTLVSGWLYEDDLRPAAQLDGVGTIVNHFIYATGINVPDYMIRSSVTYRLITDHLGSVRLVVNTATGAIAQRLDYDEFGRVLADTSPGFQPFGFAGGLYDPDTGLVRFGARDYDSVVGRWMAKDPIRFEGGDTNLYGYVGNMPINHIDSSGLVGPIQGPPNSCIWTCPEQIRHFGPDGKAKTDVDFGHANNHPEIVGPHAHDWDWSNSESPERSKKPRPATPEEMRCPLPENLSEKEDIPNVPWPARVVDKIVSRNPIALIIRILLASSPAGG